MKTLLTLAALFIMTASYAWSHSSSGHSYSHTSSEHFSEHPSTHSYSEHEEYHVSPGSSYHASSSRVRSYSAVTAVRDEEIHSYPSGSTFTYYYLLFNHNTNTNDTIKSKTKEDLKSQVIALSAKDDGPTSVAVYIILFVVCLLILIAIGAQLK